MIPRVDVVGLTLGDSPEQIQSVFLESRHSRFPVLEKGTRKIIGVLLAKDVYGRHMAEGDQVWANLKDMCREAIVVPETVRIAVLFETMRQHRGHLAIVVDEYGELAGIVTIEDLLEEIVGEIADETDAGQPYEIVENGEGWQAHGLVPLSDLHRELGLTVGAALDANTLSGLFMLSLGRMPRLGDQIVQDGFELEVLGMDAHHVESVQIRKPAAPEDGSPDSDKPGAA